MLEDTTPEPRGSPCSLGMAWRTIGGNLPTVGPCSPWELVPGSCGCRGTAKSPLPARTLSGTPCSTPAKRVLLSPFLDVASTFREGEGFAEDTQLVTGVGPTGAARPAHSHPPREWAVLAYQKEAKTQRGQVTSPDHTADEQRSGVDLRHGDSGSGTTSPHCHLLTGSLQAGPWASLSLLGSWSVTWG